MKQLVIMLDAAHGADVPGKQSPDGTHKEYLWSRKMCKKLRAELEKRSFSVVEIVPEDKEPGLSVRVARADMVPGVRKLLISLHNNAAGDGSRWMNATGVEIFTTPGQTKSDQCAEIIMRQLRNDFPELKFRIDTSDGDQDKEANFTVLTGRSYMAVLLEWLFMDNVTDLAIIRMEGYQNKLVNSIASACETIETQVK